MSKPTLEDLVEELKLKVNEVKFNYLADLLLLQRTTQNLMTMLEKKMEGKDEQDRS